MMKMKIAVSLFALILLVNLVESSYDCYTIFRQSDRTCHRGFSNKPTAEACCESSHAAEAVGQNGWNGHCVPCWEV